MDDVKKIRDGYYEVVDADGNTRTIVVTEQLDENGELYEYEAIIVLDSEEGYGETEEEAIENAIANWNDSEETDEEE